MTGPALKVLIVGRFGVDALEGSYLRAFRGLGHAATSWDMPQALGRHARLGRIGSVLNAFLPVEAWVMKANRDLLLAALESKPDLVLIFGRAHALAGALGQIKAALPHCSLVLVWPDSLLYCSSWVLDALPVYDLIAACSQAMVEPLHRLGAHRAAWVPFAFDPELHPGHLDPDPAFSHCDASFVGNYTPERERLMVRLTSEGLRLRVWGPVEWERSARDRPALKKYWQGGPLFGADFSVAVRSAPVSLNPINPITWPAANMRLFEIPGCGGVAVSARSPEMETELPAGEACYYYDDEAHAAAVIRTALNEPERRRHIAHTGRGIILAAHTYRHRASRILELLSLGPACGAT